MRLFVIYRNLDSVHVLVYTCL